MLTMMYIYLPTYLSSLSVRGLYGVGSRAYGMVWYGMVWYGMI